jgi:hypothetical protein
LAGISPYWKGGIREVPSIEAKARGCTSDREQLGSLSGFKGGNLLLKDELLEAKKVLLPLDGSCKACNDPLGLLNSALRVLEDGRGTVGHWVWVTLDVESFSEGPDNLFDDKVVPIWDQVHIGQEHRRVKAGVSWRLIEWVGRHVEVKQAWVRSFLQVFFWLLFCKGCWQ